MKPLLAAAATEAADDQLVAAVREGSEEAFEALYRRYRPRIVAFVRSKVPDHARAEDIAQEAFVSALRGLRSSEREIAFRPWLYEIARNACIDHLRRAGRAAEVSMDSDDFSPQEEGRISQSVSGTDAEVARRNELEALQMAFGDLPESQHQILVMRELEGLSYERIGSRMGLSQGAVESMLFRARRTLRDGFDDIDTGERCRQMHVAMESAAAKSRLGLRDRRRLAVHLRHCAGCRRMAVSMGLDELALAGAGRPGPLGRIAALLPLPAFIRRRIADAAGALNSVGPGAEPGISLGAKAAAVVTVAALAAGGAGVATKASGGGLPLPGGLGGGPGQAADARGAGGSGDPSGAGSNPGRAARRAGAPQGPGSRVSEGAGRAGGSTAARSGGAREDGGGPAGHVVDRIAGALPGAGSGTTGSAGSTGETVDRTAKQVTGLVDGTVRDLTQGTTQLAPKLPKTQLPDTGAVVPGTGGGSPAPSLPGVGDALGSTQLQAPQAPRVRLPQAPVSVPDTGVRLP